MSQERQSTALWADEIEENGLSAVIADRLKFHGGLNINFVMHNTGCCAATVRKHLERLVQNGSATRGVQGDCIYYRPAQQ